MADLNARIIAKASATAGEAPQAADLEVAEIAVNTADGKFFTKHTDGTIKEISGSGSGEGGESPSYVGTTGSVAGNYDVGANGLTYGYPAGSQVGDLAIFIMSCRSGADNTYAAPQPPAGYTEALAPQDYNGNIAQAKLSTAAYVKTIEASDLTSGSILAEVLPANAGDDFFGQLHVFRNAAFLGVDYVDTTAPGDEVPTSGYDYTGSGLSGTQAAVFTAMNLYAFSDGSGTSLTPEVAVTEIDPPYLVDGVVRRLTSWATPGGGSADFNIKVLNDNGSPSAITEGFHITRINLTYSGTGSGGGSGIPEAPVDGQQYARQDAAWTVVQSGGGSDISINDLTDVDTNTTPPAQNQVLAWDGSEWKPGNTITLESSGTSTVKGSLLINDDIDGMYIGIDSGSNYSRIYLGSEIFTFRARGGTGNAIFNFQNGWNSKNNQTTSLRLWVDGDPFNGGKYFGWKTDPSMSSSYELTLPPSDGAAGQVLSTNGSGTLSWGDNETITLASLKSVVAASADFADFQSRISAL